MDKQSTPRGVLVPLDGSPFAERALPYARDLVAPGGDVILMQVVPDPEPIRNLLGGIVADHDEVLARYLAAGQEYLTNAAKLLGDGVAVRTEAVGGEPEPTILAVAARERVALIAMASHGRGAVGRLVFGSVADKVARTSVVPVLIVHPHDEGGAAKPAAIKRLLVPLDGSDLALEAVPVAAAYATRLGIPVHLLRAIDIAATLPPVSPGPVADIPVSGEVYDQIYGEVKQEAERSLATAAGELERDGVTVTRKVVEGPAAAVIIEATAPGDLLILTSHGRSGFTRWLLGSVAERLIRTGAAPVILVPASARTAAVAGGAPPAV